MNPMTIQVDVLGVLVEGRVACNMFNRGIITIQLDWLNDRNMEIFDGVSELLKLTYYRGHGHVFHFSGFA